ncbi:ABC transporter substrate-binding protein (plasmid) [Agrobacterium tumefaciens]|uniref:ABC transporter substrate-binding protein n=4 Tax=Rhizobium/Agrobacterium group TaxID=227290 RepID=A0A2Z2PME7_AGRTU|nr:MULTISPECIES: ABC transporter substrate-binding protein [Rhizobium/Agrobacterium group]ASK41103.1 ABC transporter substrate-binding protein [Rhizobium rhizogenes]ASK41266.1 ABC transporter substrate-binding protein [Agrobacterium tumefaciens]NTI46442.1 ABC transporter substrate-binding protein [Rhizobium rhizogenes]NTI65945.1 ABC transporter substrate-binding protein [Rhizobium rhizogenes]UXR95251.1 ABC transporter substrate-binding protein [Agrobacterium tumefaciens]
MLKTNRRNFMMGTAAIAVASTAGAKFTFAQERRALRLGVNGLPNSLEPVNAISNVGPRIVNQIFDTLIARDFFAKGAPGNAIDLVPALAESWERIDEKSVRFKLRQKVMFHDGVELTADDVAYTFSSERLWGPEAIKKIPLGKSYSLDFDEPVVEDKYTVTLRTKTPSYLIETFVASWMSRIVPKEYYKKLGAVDFGNKPVGTGPYKFVEFVAGDRVVLEANDAYWGPKPTASKITYQIVAEPATRVAGLISGEYDIITTLTPDDIQLINSYPDLETRGTLIENFHMFTFNMNQEVFKDKKLRRALALAVNRPIMVEALWKKQASIPHGFNFPNYGETFDPNRPAMEYNVEEAKRLVTESGYDGTPITYRTMGNYYANAVPALMMMVEMWKEIGVTVVPEIFAPGTTVPDNQSWMRNWSNGQWMTDAYATIVPEFGPNGQVQKRWGWQAPAEFNELCEKVTVLPNGKERFDAYSRMRDIFEAEAPAVILYQPYDVYAARKDVHWTPVSFEMMEFRNNLSFA